MPSAASTSAAAIRGTGAIRAGITLLGTVGFALSYDALCQMAVAIHVRGLLTYAFPLVIDGFIAIGVGALIILRTAPLLSRLYVWMLVGIATATSIWANALHAIRLNQQTRHTGLHLDDHTVGALSAIAPLALAGAVHLYLVVRRHPGHHLRPQEDPSATKRHIDAAYRRSATLTAHDPKQRETSPKTTGDVAEGSAGVADTREISAKPRGRQPSATMDELLAIGRNAPRGRDGRVSRRSVEAAIRAKGHGIGRTRLDDATHTLQAELDDAPADRA
jgi:hypothetical protein